MTMGNENAYLKIKLMLVDKIIDGDELDSIDMEYYDSTHEKLEAMLRQLQSERDLLFKAHSLDGGSQFNESRVWERKMNEYFKSQLDEGATDQFFYAIEREGNLTIQRHRGTLDTFPNLEYVRHSTLGVPLFKEME